MREKGEIVSQTYSAKVKILKLVLIPVPETGRKKLPATLQTEAGKS